MFFYINLIDYKNIDAKVEKKEMLSLGKILDIIILKALDIAYEIFFPKEASQSKVRKLISYTQPDGTKNVFTRPTS